MTAEKSVGVDNPTRSAAPRVARRIQRPGRWLTVGLFCATAAACARVESYEKPLTPVRVRTIERQAAPETGVTARYSANLQPNTQVELAFKTGGAVAQILQTNGRIVQEGDWVARGSTLARLRDAEMEARGQQAKADLNEARAAQAQIRAKLTEARGAREQSKRELDRAIRLFERDSLTRPEYEAAKSKSEMSEAQVLAAEAQLEMADARAENVRARIEEWEAARADYELKSPMDGLVLKRNVEIGAFIAPGAPAFVLADTTLIKVVFGVSDAATAQLRPGDRVTVTTEAMRGALFHGQLTRISPLADPKTRIFEAEAAVPNPGRRLKAGMVVSLQMAAAQAATPKAVAPLAALFQADGRYAVFVIEDRDGRQFARRRLVTTGETLGDFVVVAGGAEPGDRVVVSGASLLNDGEQVRVVQ